MRILYLGDIVGRTGRDAVGAALPGLREQLKLDLIVVNGENASHGFGLAPDMADALFQAGADAIVLGNHSWDRKEIVGYIGNHPRLLRPRRRLLCRRRFRPATRPPMRIRRQRTFRSRDYEHDSVLLPELAGSPESGCDRAGSNCRRGGIGRHAVLRGRWRKP